jgi:hypothetical protein
MFCECLSASQPSVGWAHRPGCDEHFTVPLQHYECGFLVGQPAESSQSDESVAANDDQSLEPMPHTRQPKVSALRPDPILNAKMSRLHADTDAEPIERENSVLGNLLNYERLR